MPYLEHRVRDTKRARDVETAGRKENLEDGRCAEGDRTINIVGMIYGERVDVSTISSLFDGELARLGVGTIGDRHRLSTH